MSKYALISVSDKRDVTKVAKALDLNGYKIIATGNTGKLLKQEGFTVVEVESLTGFPEIFNGRVKTLHPKIFGGILMRRNNESDINEAETNKIFPIDVVCVNLYPFKEVIKNQNTDLQTAIENIDIGGPSLIRAAAKNHKYVCVMTNPGQYQEFINELNNGEISESIKQRFAVEAFSHSANYDTYIANYLEEKYSFCPTYIRINHPLSTSLRYGENPHQKSEIYGSFKEYFDILHGKELSYNNILDLVSAVELVDELGENSCAIIKHNNPAGAAIAKDGLNAYTKALKCDPVSAFGGIVAFNCVVDKNIAEKLNEIFLEVVSAPDYTEDALELLYKKKNRRIIKQNKTLPIKDVIKSVPGGVIRQTADNVDLITDQLKILTDKKPTDDELKDLKFAWKVAKHTKSNSIVFAKDQSTLGVGAGQMSRIDSVKIANMKSKEHGLDLKGSVAASDAFFPFADGLLEIVKCGATAVIQPGGSVKDDEVIEAANNSKISMVFTGIRHFKH